MFSCICRTTGLYTKTLAKIIRQDVTRFMVVFAVVFLSFCGSLFLSLRSSKQSQQFRCVLLVRLRKLLLIQLAYSFVARVILWYSPFKLHKTKFSFYTLNLLRHSKTGETRPEKFHADDVVLKRSMLSWLLLARENFKQKKAHFKHGKF